jgi:hypothetical protein
MPLKPVINVKCPCCKEILEIDVEKQRVRAHRKGKHLKDDAEEGEDGLDVALRQQKEHTSSLDSRFNQAQDKLKGQKDRLEQLFSEAKEKAKDMEDEPDDPDNPFKGGKIWD